MFLFSAKCLYSNVIYLKLILKDSCYLTNMTLWSHIMVKQKQKQHFFAVIIFLMQKIRVMQKINLILRKVWNFLWSGRAVYTSLSHLPKSWVLYRLDCGEYYALFFCLWDYHHYIKSTVKPNISTSLSPGTFIRWVTSHSWFIFLSKVVWCYSFYFGIHVFPSLKTKIQSIINFTQLIYEEDIETMVEKLICENAGWKQ